MCIIGIVQFVLLFFIYLQSTYIILSFKCFYISCYYYYFSLLRTRVHLLHCLSMLEEGVLLLCCFYLFSPAKVYFFWNLSLSIDAVNLSLPSIKRLQYTGTP